MIGITEMLLLVRAGTFIRDVYMRFFKKTYPLDIVINGAGATSAEEWLITMTLRNESHHPIDIRNMTCIHPRSAQLYDLLEGQNADTSAHVYRFHDERGEVMPSLKLAAGQERKIQLCVFSGRDSNYEVVCLKIDCITHTRTEFIWATDCKKGFWGKLVSLIKA